MVRSPLFAVWVVLALPAARAADDGPPKPLAEAITKLVQQNKVPGAAVAVVADYKLLWAGGFGVREAGGDPVASDTLFQMASVSKPVAGIAAAALAEQGRLDLDADVNTVLKSWKLPAAGPPVTLRQLFGHRGGTTVHGFPGYAADKPVPSLVQVLDGKSPANTPAVRVERKPWATSGVRYSGGGICVCQLAMTDRTGKAFPDLMAELVFDKLGLKNCTYAQPLPDRYRGRAATAHTANGKPVPGRYNTYPEMAAAGLWASAPDVAAVFADLAAAWAGKPAKTLSKAAARNLFATGVGWPERYAGDEFVAVHGGSNRGFRCVVAVEPRAGRVVVVQTNSDAGGGLLDPVLKAVSDHYKW